MREEGQIVLVSFPNTDLSSPKLRPALLLKQLPGEHDDWLLCLISTKLHQEIKDFDEVINETDDEFESSGLKQKSLIRISKLAVVSGVLLPGAIGSISEERLERILQKLANWLYELLLEDLADLKAIEERRGEKAIPLSEIKKRRQEK